MVENEEIIRRPFRCQRCNTTHIVPLNKKILEGRKKFPFPYVFLHDSPDHEELITILYIDSQLQIRHSEVQELGTDLLFSKEQVVAMTKPLLEEIEYLRTELQQAKAEITKLKNNH